jgi:hypothetical protein
MRIISVSGPPFPTYRPVDKRVLCIYKSTPRHVFERALLYRKSSKMGAGVGGRGKQSTWALIKNFTRKIKLKLVTSNFNDWRQALCNPLLGDYKEINLLYGLLRCRCARNTSHIVMPMLVARGSYPARPVLRREERDRTGLVVKSNQKNLNLPNNSSEVV